MSAQMSVVELLYFSSGRKTCGLSVIKWHVVKDCWVWLKLFIFLYNV